MFFYTVFCILATSFVVGECHHHHQHKKRHNDYTNSTEIDCVGEREGLILTMKNATCKPHYRHVSLKSMPFEQFHPSVVSVRRCDGNCPGHSCMPLDTKMIKIPVRLNTYHPTKMQHAMCAIVEVEKHTRCRKYMYNQRRITGTHIGSCRTFKRCMCLQKETDCDRITQVYMPHRCACVCRDQESKKQKCEMKPGMLWNDDDCSCSCTEMNIGCTSGHEWNREKCECTPA